MTWLPNAPADPGSGRARLILLAVLRIAVGWHLLYEGLVKLADPGWSSAAFLTESRWIFSGIFHWIAANPTALKLVDLANIWGLTLIGAALLLGVLARPAAILGSFLLFLYYVAYPPLIAYTSGGMPVEGSYLVVNKNLVELLALLVLALFPSTCYLALDPLLRPFLSRAGNLLKGNRAGIPSVPPNPSRRDLLHGLGTLPLAGAFGLLAAGRKSWESYEERHLLGAARKGGADAVSRPTVKVYTFSSLKDLKGTVPKARIGQLELSRVILGGNLIGGWAHARDLIYVSKLVKAYHTDQKVFDTFRIAESCGINTILTNPQLVRVINEYRRKEGGTIQFISDCGYGSDLIKGIQISIDGGAQACYAHGGIADKLVEEGKVEEIGRAVDLIRQNGLPAGIGGHKLQTVKACVEAGIRPDFWVKTLHHCDYWSAKLADEHDNIWCTDPEETAQFMSRLEEPWIAYKVLAAGAIQPEVGFSFAFRNGADFICVGMYDFQIVDDVNIALSVLKGPLERTRAWRA